MSNEPTVVQFLTWATQLPCSGEVTLNATQQVEAKAVAELLLKTARDARSQRVAVSATVADIRQFLDRPHGYADLEDLT